MRLRKPEREEALLDQVERSPGASLRQIHRLSGIPLATAQRLLNALEEAGRVRSERGPSTQSHRRFYPAGRGLHKRERVLLGFLSKPRARDLLEAIRDEPGIRHSDLAAKVGLPAPTVTYYLKQLVGEDLVMVRAAGVQRHYRIKNPVMLEKALERRAE